MRKQIFINEASFFASIPMMIIMGILSIVTIYFSLEGLSFVLLFITAVSAVSCAYNGISLKNIQVTFDFMTKVYIKGDTIKLKCSIANAGRLPVIKGKIRIPVLKESPVDASGCDGYRELSIEEISKSRLYGESVTGVLEGEIDYLAGGERATCVFAVKGKARGIWRLDEALVYCSDITGLSHEGRKTKTSKEVLICPEIINVREEPFICNLMLGDTGLKSNIDDITLIKGNRIYRESDPIKSINWSFLAKGQGLVVNEYDKIFNKSLHFIIDSESFNNKYTDRRIFEKILSLAFSEIVKLQEHGLGCGLSLPAQDGREAVNIFYEGKRTINIIGESLAKCAMKTYETEKAGLTILQKHSSMSSTIIKAREQRAEREGLQSSVSEFNGEELILREGEIGEFFYFTYDAGKLTENMVLEALSAKKKISIVTYRPYELKNEHLQGKRRIINFVAIAEGR